MNRGHMAIMGFVLTFLPVGLPAVAGSPAVAGLPAVPYSYRMAWQAGNL